MKSAGLMTTDTLRSLVREVLDEALRTPGPPQPFRLPPEPVHIASNEDLQAFVSRIVDMMQDSTKAEGLRSGRISFTLAGALNRSSPPSAKQPIFPNAVVRLEGVVTEARLVAAGARPGAIVQLADSAVATPSARDRARLLGITFQRG